jgi:Domain of unknown function (DUF4399)
MRIIQFLPVAILFGAVACNNASETSNPPATDSVKAAASHDSMNMGHMDPAQAQNALPAIPAGAKVYFKNLKDGQTVTSPFKVEMGVDGIRLDTAGVIVAGSGHHHLLIDAGDSIPAGQAVPKDATHLHFGKAQSSAEVTLTPGKHVLTLQYADGIHRSYGGVLAATITVTVK